MDTLWGLLPKFFKENVKKVVEFVSFASLRFVGPALDALHEDQKNFQPFELNQKKDLLRINKGITLRNIEYHYPNSSKIALNWNKVNVTYTIQIREYKDTDVPIIHERTNLTVTTYDYSNFVEGNEYSWSVFAEDDLGFSSEASSQNDLRIGTTKFLAFMLFNDWEVPFLLLGVMMVIALQAGVFLAREEKDD